MSGEHFYRGAHDQVRVTDSAGLDVMRGVNSLRLTLLGVLIGIALTVGFGIGGWLGVVGGVAAFVVSASVIRNRKTTHWLMGFMHWLLRDQG